MKRKHTIAVSMLKDTLHTSKGIISNKFSFNDVIRAYGNNYLKVIHGGSEAGNNRAKTICYSIIYIDINPK